MSAPGGRATCAASYNRHASTDPSAQWYWPGSISVKMEGYGSTTTYCEEAVTLHGTDRYSAQKRLRRRPGGLSYIAGTLSKAKSAADQRIVRKCRAQRGFVRHHSNDTTIKCHLAARTEKKRGSQQHGKLPTRYATSASRNMARIRGRHEPQHGGHTKYGGIALDQHRVIGPGFVKPPENHWHTCIDRPSHVTGHKDIFIR
jgi:hypothetical protein